jgi:ABC-type glutathione transport system ATPase component
MHFITWRQAAALDPTGLEAMTDTPPAGGHDLLTVENLSVSFRSRHLALPAVRALNFSVKPGRTVALVGESGSGKSVTALSILRLIEREGGTIDGGTIRFAPAGSKPVDILELPENDLRRIRGNAISMIFQEPMTSLNPVMRIGDQLAEVLKLHRGATQAAAMTEARRMLDMVRIPASASRLEQYPHELSGGMRQRVMIAMSLLCRPQLLIADEPTTALDVTIQDQILALMAELQREIGMALLFITHDLGVVAQIADEIVVMRHGEKVEQNFAAGLFAAPRHDYTRLLLDAVPRLGQEQGPAAQANESEPPLLRVRNLTKRFAVRRGPFKRLTGYVHAVENVSLDLERGETLSVVGESGCGKSTLARLMMRLISPSAGSITIGDTDVTRLTQRQVRPIRRNIQMIFQDPYASLNPRLPAIEIITEPLAIHDPGVTHRQRRDRAVELLERVGLSADHLTRYPHQFSGGQRQRLSIARALCLNPKIIIADEPVSALDVSIQAQVVDLLRDLQADLGISYVFISHDMGVVEQMSHRVAVMYLGQVVEIGPAASVLGDPKHAYTKRLLEAVPIPDPKRRSERRLLASTEIPSPMRSVDDPPSTPPLREIGQGHFVQVA